MIEFVGIEIPEGKTLVRTEMESGVLFTFEPEVENVDDAFGTLIEDLLIFCGFDNLTGSLNDRLTNFYKCNEHQIINKD